MTEGRYPEPNDIQTSVDALPPYSNPESSNVEWHEKQRFLRVVWRLGVGVLCLLVLGYIAKEDNHWTRWTRSYLHLAVNASTGQTFGKLLRSPTVQTIMASSRNLLRVEQGNVSHLPKFSEAAGGMNLTDAVWPIQGKLIRRFGWTQSLPGGKQQFSQGIVLIGRAGDPVLAIHSGRVVTIEPESPSGWMVALDHLGRWRSVYHNLGKVMVRLDQEISTGGLLGSLKSDSKPQDLQLRLELYEAGRLIDPLTVIGPG